MKIQTRFTGFRVQPHRSFAWDGEIGQSPGVTRAVGSLLKFFCRMVEVR